MYIRVIGSSPGESVVIVFDSGYAITIDCCKTSGENHTINALNELGIPPSKVLYNVITHFHDDHIKGISELVTHCHPAKVVIPDAWTEDVFKIFVATVSRKTTLGDFSVTTEIEKVFDAIQVNKSRLLTVSEMSVLYPPVAQSYGSTEQLTVMTPTAARKAKFLTRLAEDIIGGVSDAFGFCERNKNWTSIACVVRSGANYMFLGGDVENNSPEFDLSSVHKNHDLSNIKRYELVKLPHHGSDTSFCDELRALIDNEHTVVAITPYPRGHKPLPCDETQTYLHDAKRVYVLSGRKIRNNRSARMRRSDFLIEPIAKYKPGILDFMEGEVDATECQSLGDFLARA